MSNLNPGGLTRVLNYVKTWVTGLLNDKANSSHSHTKSQITDFPTIPTVNNATLTIQKNSSNVATFTANASSNVTANITVPTKTSDLTNDSGYITSTGSCSYSTTSGTSTYSTYLKSLGAQTPKSGRDIFHSGVYTYTTFTDTNTPAHYGAVIGYGNGQGGSCEMFAEWVGSGQLWFRVLRDYQDSWTNWQQIITSNNIGSQSVNYANSAGSVAWGNVSGKPSTYTPSSHTHDDRYYTESEINTLLLSKVYPVGAIYISVNSVNPGTLFGGTWERIKDKFLLSSGDTYSIGSTGGNSSTTLGIANLPSHNHTGTTGNESQGHTHSGTTGNQSANHTHTFSGTTSWKDSHSHTTWTDSQGSHSHNSGHGWHNVEPGSDRQCLSDHYIDSDGWSGNITSSAGSHGHHIYMDSAGAHDHTYSGTTSGISANHTHDFTTGGISAHHTHSFTTSSVGSTQAFSNMPPYLTVNIWKRTA